MTKFKLNARLFGGVFVLLPIIAVLLIPLYLIVLETGLSEQPSSVIQVEGTDVKVPNNPLAFGILAIMVFLVLLILIRIERRRNR